MTSSTNDAAPRTCAPSTRSSSVRSRRAAHWAHGEPATREDDVAQLGQRRGIRELNLLGTAGDRHPRRLTGQPHAHLHPGREGGRRDREGLVEPLQRLDTAGGLDDKAVGSHAAQATICRVETFYLSLLVLTALVVAWFAAYVVYRLVKTPA
jgi:hypothetical protein